MTDLLERFDGRLHQAVTAISADPDRQEAVGWRLVKVGGSLAITSAAVLLGMRGALYFWGDLL